MLLYSWLLMNPAAVDVFLGVSPQRPFASVSSFALFVGAFLLARELPVLSPLCTLILLFKGSKCIIVQ